MSGREYSQELGRKFVFAVANFFESLHRKDGTKIYQLISNAYETHLRQFCDITLPERTISFDIVFRRYILRKDAFLVYVECKYAESVHTIRALKPKYEEFLENVYLCKKIRKYQDAEFMFVTNVPFIYGAVPISDNFTLLKEILTKRLSVNVEEALVSQMLHSVHKLVIPQWFLEQINI